MELKDFQKRVVGEVEGYLRALAKEREGGNKKHAGKDAWEAVGLGRYEERRNGLGEDLPTFCIKVPTGGGKTLLATQVLGSIYRTILRDRNGAGLVLWVVPSSQIYRDTLRRLRDRNDMYRIMLEHAASRRIEVWEKHEIARLSPARLRECLNILIVQLASTNRETKDQLKFFKDSGGNIVDHFPLEEDLAAHRKLRSEMPNLEVIEGTDLLKTSVGNLVRLCRPAVVIDEGHKATSELARKTIEGFNAAVVVELSATPPKGANIVSRVTGEQLLKEEMIKLPINIATSGQQDWKDVVTKARDKRVALARSAMEWSSAKGGGEGRLIRPIVLVQVERTGKDQRGPKWVHALDVKEYLMQKLSVPEGAIAVKTADNDGLEDVDLLDEGCRVEWIITKSALQEGWDCPFAYVLVSLNASGSGTAMTQLVGRILRQPFQTRVGEKPELNESYVFCLKQKAGEAAKLVKKALEDEGYEGEAAALVRTGDGAAAQGQLLEIPIKREFTRLYGKPFVGKVYLPRFCVKEGERVRPLDYFQDLLRRVDVGAFDYSAVSTWGLAEALAEAKDRFQKVSLGHEAEDVGARDADLIEPDERVLAWLIASLRFDYLSHKQLRVIVERVYEEIAASHLTGMVKDKLALVKFAVRNRTEEFIQHQLDRQTEAAFDTLFDSKKIFFYLECKECNFEIPESIRIEVKGKVERLAHDDGRPIANSLFEYDVTQELNEYEKQVALVLDRDANVLWWYRNRVGRDQFMVQGYKRGRIYPDFLVQEHFEGKKTHRVLVVESKGEHLDGNPDTEYKRKVAAYFERAGHKLTWQELGTEFKDHVFRFQVLDEAQEDGREWSDALREKLAEV
jgi:type III restriction enzyme